MYRIDENSNREKYILLIPAMLDMHFPLLKYAFYSKNYHPVVLENDENIVNQCHLDKVFYDENSISYAVMH